MTLIEKIQNEISENEIMYATIAKPSHQMANAHVGTITGLMIALNLVQEHSDWVSLSERLPEFGQQVLTCKGQYVGIRKLYQRGSGKLRWDNGMRLDDFEQVTHWQPLPQPPSEVLND